MIVADVVLEVQQLLIHGSLSNRAIAQLVGISRGTVNAIAARRTMRREAADANDVDAEGPLGPPQRCPTCGGMVFMPCRLCRMRALQSKEPRNRASRVERGEPLRVELRLELRPEHAARYEQARVWRRQALISGH